MANSAVLRIAIGSSPRLAALLVLLHLAAALVACVTAMPWAAALPILILIVLSLAYHLARDALLLLPHAWREINLDSQGVSVVSRDGSRLTGRPANRTVVNSCFILLAVKPEGRRRSVSRIIFPDALSAGSYRELCVYLKFAG